MKKFAVFILIMLAGFCNCILSACSASINNNHKQHAMINDIDYSSLSNAVKEAKDGDTIKVYNDITENKNVIIDKSINIVGVNKTGQSKPNLYGSITINAKNADDMVKIENLSTINTGKSDDNATNNTLVAVNLLDGGLSLKFCKISPDKQAENGASGVIISRSIDSDCNMPIVVSGNSFGAYKSDENSLKGALIVKSNKSGEYKNLNLPVQDFMNKNTFSSEIDGNQFVFADYSTSPAKYTHFMTSSTDQLLDALLTHQSDNFSSFTLTNGNEILKDYSEPIYILPGTSLLINGNNPVDLAGITFKVSGNVFIDAPLSNAIFERISDTANITFGENVDQIGVIIQ